MYWALLVSLLIASPAALAATAPAGAAGDPTLNRLIIANPEPGWSRAPTQEQAALQSIRQLTASAAAGANATGAVKAWMPPNNSGGALGIELLNFPSGIPGLNSFSARTTCVHSRGSSVVVQQISSVPNSTAATCLIPSVTTGGAAARATVAEAAKGNYVMLVFAELPSTSPTTITVSDLAGILKQQYDALPGGSGSTSTILVVLGLVVVIVAAVGLILVWRNSRRTVRPEVVMATAEETLGPHWTGSPTVLGIDTYETAEWAGTPTELVDDPGAPGPEPPHEVDDLVDDPAAPEPEVAEPKPEPVAPSEPGAVTSKAKSIFKRAQGAVKEPAREPGWYPENGDETKQFYWDGEQIVARIEWNGTEWVELI